VETGAWWGLIVELDLVPLQIVTLQRCRVLLVLGFKGTRAHLGLELVEDFAWFTLWIEHIANPPAMGSAPRQGNDLVAHGNGRKVQMTISALAAEVSGDIIFMQSLLDGDDGTGLFVIETAEQGLVDKPLRLGPRFRIGRVLGLHQVIDNDQVGPDACDCAADGGGKAITALARAKVS